MIAQIILTPFDLVSLQLPIAQATLSQIEFSHVPYWLKSFVLIPIQLRLKQNSLWLCSDISAVGKLKISTQVSPLTWALANTRIHHTPTATTT